MPAAMCLTTATKRMVPWHLCSFASLLLLLFKDSLVSAQATAFTEQPVDGESTFVLDALQPNHTTLSATVAGAAVNLTTQAPLSAATSAPALRPTFDIRPHPEYPWGILQVFYRPEPSDTGYYLDYRVNYTDLSAVTGAAGPPGSYTLAGNNPFSIYGLHPGHQYSIKITGDPVDKTEPSQFLYSGVTMTAPRHPSFSGPKAVSTTTATIMLKGEKHAGALQDWFRVEYDQLRPAKSYKALVVNDLRDQHTVELFVPNLRAGREHNVSVYAVIRDGDGRQIESEPWNAIVTTKPLPPSNVRVAAGALGSRELRLVWDAPAKSGVDYYRVLYQPADRFEPDSVVTLNDVADTGATVREGLAPGARYRFSVYSVKSGETSEAANGDITMRPLPPTAMNVSADYASLLFDVRVSLAAADTAADSCGLRVVHETADELQARNYTARVADGPGGTRSCTLSIALVAGERYELTARSLANGTESAGLPLSTVVEPAFDMQRFGVRAAMDEPRHSILVSVSPPLPRPTLSQMWPALVGSGSRLHAELRLAGDKLTEAHMSPLDNDSAVIEFADLVVGQCYEVLLYTVTTSGIVSRNRSSVWLRSPAPYGSMRLVSANQTAAELYVTVSAASALCRLAFTARRLDTEPPAIVDTQTHSLSEKTRFDLRLAGLVPYTNYSCEAVVTCGVHARGASQSQCADSTFALAVKTLRTAEGRPGPVRELAVRPEKPYAAAVSWRTPLQPNGRIVDYVLGVTPLGGGERPWNVTVAPDFSHIMTHRLSNLTGGLTYEVSVLARTRAGLGDAFAGGSASADAAATSRQANMPIWAPPAPADAPAIVSNAIHTTDFAIRFRPADVFMTRHGLLTKYAVLVQETDADGRLAPEPSGAVASWSSVRSSERWPVFVAVEKRLPPNKIIDPTAVVQVIGFDDTCPPAASSSTREQQQQQPPPVYCNGPLRPGRYYRVKLRVFTADALFADSPYSQVVRTGEHSSGATIAIVAVLLIVCALVLSAALFAVYIVRQRKVKLRPAPVAHNHNRSHKRQSRTVFRRIAMVMAAPAHGCLSKLGMSMAGNLGASTSSGRSSDLGSASLSAQVHRRSRSLRERAGIDGRLDRLPGTRLALQPLRTVADKRHMHYSRPVRLVDFAEHCGLMSADSDFRFSEEYEELKQVGGSQAAVAADMPCNRVKNRFTNILPFDHSRVKLTPIDDDDGSDYINASYIPGYHSRREFIAAQGPLAATRDDFWRMVYEQQCPAVVNLTKCVEKGRDKCYKYWPDTTEPLRFGDFEVTLLNETKMNGEYEVRQYEMVNVEDGSQPVRTVYHLHYLAWPDFGVPDRPQSIVEFIYAFRQRVPPSASSHRPSVVHCSAGVGRSGTFIAVDTVLQSLEAQPRADLADIFNIVYEMRKDRVAMVQTEQQYISIHQCVLHVLQERGLTGALAASNAAAAAAAANNTGSTLLAVPHAHLVQQRSAPPVARPLAHVHQNPAFEDDDEGIVESGM